MTTTGGPFGGSTDVPFSDAALLVVSVCGFSMLAIMVYSLIVTRLKSGSELDREIVDEKGYEEMLKRSDVSTLTRAERRARAHAIMKEKRRVDQQAGHGDGGLEIHQLQQQPGAQMSRKERQKAAKAQEKAERSILDSARQEQQRLAQEEAQKRKLQRETDEALRRKDEADRSRIEREAREQALMGEWQTFLSTSNRSQSVDEWLDEMKRKRSVRVIDIANEFGVTVATVVDRIELLLKQERVAGVIDENNCFIFLDDEELSAIAKIVEARGSVSLAEIGAIVEQLH